MIADPMDEMDKRPRVTAHGDVIAWRPDVGGWQDEDLPELGDIWSTLASMPEPPVRVADLATTPSASNPQDPAGRTRRSASQHPQEGKK